tara:strand:- start:204 stop:575 length:372 start_codon:yes stop_codon:yes gene_type:complete
MLLHQVRINSDDTSSIILKDILEACNAELVCQYDAFFDYCVEAEENNVEDYPLYKWTKAVIADPDKTAKYRSNFTVYVDGEQLYPLEVANTIYSRLENLPFVDSIKMHDNNPANNPQIPDEYK